MPFVAAPRTCPFRLLRLACCAASLALLTAPGASAQTSTSVTDGSTPSALTPGAPAGSYPLSGFESVNLYNGNLNFALPLVRTGGRGSAGASVTLKIERHWRVKTLRPLPNCQLTGTSCDPIRLPDFNGWIVAPDYGPGVLKGRQPGADCGGLAITRLTFTAGDGTEYELRDRDYGGQPKGFVCSESLGHLRGAVFVTADGTAATFVSDTVIYDSTSGAPRTLSPSGVLKLRDGSTYRIDEGRVAWARDRNGNRVSYTYEGPKVKTITDSLGRVVTINYGVSDVAPYGVCDQIVYKGFGGADRVIRVSRTNLVNVLRTTRAGDSALPKKISELFPEFESSSSTDFNPAGIVSAVWLPDDGVNLRAYRFFYNVYGELARVELPTGGATEYDFAKYSVTNDGIFRGVTERRAYADGVNLEGRTAYGDGTNPPGTVDSYDAGGVLLARSKHYFHGDPLNSLAQFPTDYSGWREGREYKTEQFGVTNGVASAAPLRRVEREWRQRAPVSWWAGTAEKEPANDPRVVETVTTVEPGGANLVTRQSSVNPQTGAVGFDQFNNPTEVWEYDYGAGAAPAYALRHTHTDYLTTNNGVDYTAASGPHLRGLQAGQQVYAVNPTTGAETPVAKSETRYDEPGYPLLSCGTTENAIPCGSAPQWDDPGTAPRGNATTARRWLDTTDSWVETHAQYDGLGNVRHTWDAKGALSQVGYLDSFCNGGGCGGTYAPNTFAFPTSTRSPKPDPSGAYSSAAELTASTVYDFYTGLVYTAKDANDQITRYEYGDPLDRLKAVVRPDGGRTDFNYGDAVGNLYVHTLNDLDAGRRTESKQYFDGLGRAYRTATYENAVAAEPWVNADTRYDALGRVSMASMPYRSARGGAPLTDGEWSGLKRAETEYDALGRVREVTTRPDGAAVTTSYSGNAVTVTDQAGRKRSSVSDALGRLTQVTEDPGGLGYVTAYAYDALGNLRTVTQGAQTRTFVYDSLSRLTSAQNPESGTASYTYDANGNLKTKIDARGTTAAYGYDALNRNVTVTYTPGGETAATPNVVRHYDNTASGAYGKGRLWWSEAAQTAQTTVDKYDAAGRPKEQTQKFWLGGDWSPQAYTTRLTYNLAGGVTTQEYPSTNKVWYQYDAAGRLGDNGSLPAFKGSLGGEEKTYASQVLYDELGGMSQERYGTTTPVYNKHFFNGRGQLAEIRVSTYPLTAAGHGTDFNRGAIINHYSISGWGATGGGSDNNANLLKQDVYVPNSDDLNTGHSLTTFFYEYDALNRLQRVREGRNDVEQWAQKYDYDRWGNRTIDHVATWNAPQPQFSADAATNRLGVPSGQAGQMAYDAAGNLTTDTYRGGEGGGGTHSYDAENRMTSAQFVSGQLQTAAYAYDADGRRVKRAAGTSAEAWQVYGAGGELLAEYAPGAAASKPRKEYGYRAGELLVMAEAGGAGGPQPAQPVSWVRAVGVMASGNSLTKTAATAWGNAGASSAQALASGDGYLEFTASEMYVERACGLSRGDSDQTLADIDFAILLSNGGFVYAFESGALKASAGAYATGDRLRVSVEAGVVKYSKNGSVFYASALTPQYPLLADASLYDQGVSVGGVVLSGSLVSTVGVAWANAVGVSASGNSLTKTGAAGWDAGASSAQALASGDGYVEFTASADRTDRLCGLSRGDDGQSVADIDFAIYLSDGGFVYAFESGALKASAGPYNTGDVLRVAVESGAVKYSKNGVVFYTSSVAPTYPLLADTSLYQTGAAVSNVRISGNLGGQGAAAVRWLVADHLGTPRMVVDRTGSLAGLSRHDYFPFGEQIGAGVGGRTTSQGYSQFDGVRQSFTGYEKDIETDLNYAANRYHSPTQGRFTSPDPLSGEQTNPQTWNHYSYVLNNPLRFVDPEGLRYVQRTLANGNIEYAWCATEECYNQATDKNAEGYAGWTAVTFDESKPFQFTTYGIGGNRYDSYRLNPDGTHGYSRILDGGSAGVTTDFGAQFAFTGLFQGLASGVRAAFGALFSRAATSTATGLTGLYGPVSAEAIASIESAAGSKATVQVFTKLTQPPALGRSLHVAVDEAGAMAARGAGQVYTARIPQPLLDQLVRSGLATKDQLVWEGGKQVTVQYQILPQASKFIVDYFK